MARYQEVGLFLLLLFTAAPIVLVFLPIGLITLLSAGVAIVYRKLARN